jgi:hypothetical protein
MGDMNFSRLVISYLQNKSLIRIISIVGERRGNWWKFIAKFVRYIRPEKDKKPE